MRFFPFCVLVCVLAVTGCSDRKLGITSCDPNQIACDGRCVDPVYDPNNCGGCGLVCPGGGACWQGQCGSSSSGGPTGPTGSSGCSFFETECDGACTDTSTDAANCGFCDNSCGVDGLCSSGVCTGSSPSSAPCTECDDGTCVDSETDAANCGGCGVVCPAGVGCNAGSCRCSSTQTSCSGVCLDLSIDPGNCGSCGNSCSAGSVCASGKCQAAENAWRMFGGNERHTGLNPAELEAPPLNLAWSGTVGAGAASPVVVDNGRAFATAKSYFSSSTLLVAFDVNSGKQLWSYDFGDVFGVGHPAADGGLVYVASCNNTPGTFLWAIDQVTGKPRWSSPFDAQWEDYWAPTVAAGSVYIDGGEYGGMYAFDAATGAQRFYASLEQYDSWSPGYYDGKVWSFVTGNLRAHDPNTGQVMAQMSVNWNWVGYSMNTAPVFDDHKAYIISPPNLYAVSTDTQQIVWTANGGYASAAAVAGGAVYALAHQNLAAHDPATGNVQWTFAGDGTLSYPPIVAGSFAYVSSADNVYAVDLTSHQQAWTASGGGWLSIAGGRLYVAHTDGTIGAYAFGPSPTPSPTPSPGP